MNPIEYTYKGFSICYQIEPQKGNQNLFSAYGYIVDPQDKTGNILAKFHTDYNTKAGVERGIKKLMEEYIDFEWHHSPTNQKESHLSPSD